MKPSAEAVAVMERERDRVCAIAAAKWGPEWLAGLTIDWSLRGTSSLGTARPLAGRIRLNAAVANANPEAFAQTVGHEIAHVVAGRVYRAAGHGPEWQAVMRAFGLPADRCSNNPEALRLHREALLRRGGVQATCGCPDGDIILTAGQALKLATGRAMYGCRKCRQPVVPIKP